VLALACLGLGLFAYRLVPREERRIAAVLEQVCSRLNQTRDEASLDRLRRALPAVLDAQIQLHVVELGDEIAGLPEASSRAAELVSGAPLTFALSSEQIQVTGDRARVDLDLLVTVSGSGEQRRDLRRTRVLLRKSQGAWLVERVEIEPVAPSEPEARP
jgi:ketosteroid isomerase-like protein